jgi:glycosyltransferase involved in cell wall biosynthesis
MVWPALELKRQGHDIDIVLPKYRGGFMHAEVHRETGKVIGAVVPSDADVIVLQRISHKHMAESIPFIRAQGVAVVIDIDDDLSSIHPKNQAYGLLHPGDQRFPMHSWVNVQRACEAATLNVLSTPALINVYGRTGNGHVVYNHVPKRYLDVKHNDSTIFGWGGSMHSHPDDPQVMGIAPARLMDEDFIFRVVGNGLDVREVLHLPKFPDVTGVVDLESAWPEVLGSLGVGVAPLSKSRFNRSKSWLKMLEMAATGVPSVVSPRPEYRRLHDQGVPCLFAEKPQEWYASLKKLLTDDVLRQEMSAKSREVAAQYTIEGNADRWLEAWTAAYEIDRGKQRRKVLSPFGLGIVNP